MKRLSKLILCLVVLIASFFAPLATLKSASASSIDTYNDFAMSVSSIFNDYTAFDERYAGTDSEKQAADYIYNYLKTKTTLTALDNDYVIDGKQEFTFESDFTGNYEKSQNIIFTYKSAKQTDKKVILFTSYDSVSYKLNEDQTDYEKIKCEGINGSAGSVATLLLLAEKLSGLSLDYNIDFCFFGAGTSSSAGTKVYAKGISEDSKKNILCAINLSTISLGSKLYYYSNEVETSFTKYINKFIDNNKLSIREVETKHLNKVTLTSPNELGLNYTHIALESDNKQFMKQGITTISLFAGDYEEGIVLGRSEFSGKDVITYTEDDNRDYIENHFGMKNVYENLFNTFSSLSTILTDTDFQNEATKAYGATKAFYNVFGNQKLVVFLTALSFIAFVMIAMCIYYKFTIKSYYSNIEVEFLSTVVKISEQVDKDGEDPTVSKVVSQVIASDIKKDKTIKPSRKKDKDK